MALAPYSMSNGGNQALSNQIEIDPSSSEALFQSLKMLNRMKGFSM